MTISDAARHVISGMVGDQLAVRVVLPDQSLVGPIDAPTTVVVHTDDAIRHLLRHPGELGFARAYVSGGIDIEGDIFDLLQMRTSLTELRVSLRGLARAARAAGPSALRDQPAPPPEEVAFGPVWRAHSKRRDAASISHHYDVSNEFYRLVLGPSWTYSCAVFENPTDSLEQAQANKYELIGRKLGLEAGMRLLDVGCGWGGMVIHAARSFGVRAVGVTISEQQAAKATQRVTEAGLSDKVEIRLQDYRDLVGEQGFDAISSIGMFEHVGQRQLQEYFAILRDLLPAAGRLLNHQIGRVPAVRRRPRLRREPTRVDPNGFMHRYVFPDGELHEIGDLVGDMQRVGFEVRHLESLREHYALTLRHWVGNLDTHWDQAVDLVGEGRARVWKLYMAASSVMFATGDLQVHQILATKTPRPDGRSGMPLRLLWERTPLDTSTAAEHQRSQR